MIKEFVLKYKKAAFLCNSQEDFIYFVDTAIQEMELIKIGDLKKGAMTKEHIIDYFMYKNTEKIYAIISLENSYKFYFYSRKYNNFEDYFDWKEHTIINFSILLRKDKILKINTIDDEIFSNN